MQAADHNLNENPSADQQEIEWQFDAVDLHLVERWLLDRSPDASISIRSATQQHIVDTYFDTDDLRFRHAGYALRLRIENGRAEATLKAIKRLRGALQKRREVTQALSHGTLAAMLSGTGPVSEQVQQLAGTHPIQPTVEIHTQRRTFALHLDGVSIGEVTLDDTSFPRDDSAQPDRLQRVEIEVSAETTQLDAFIEALCRACNLQAASIGKYELGLRLHGLDDLAA